MIRHLSALIEKEIGKMSFGNRPASLYEPIRYIMQLGGKRMRPMLTCLSYSLYRDDIATVLPYAAAVEAFHNFTLMHDDIMDNAPLRRGKATVHKKWNINTAILSGDVMLVNVYDQFLSLGNKELKEVMAIFNRTATEVCEGQQWDMEFESKASVSEAEYLGMIRQKTAVLLGFSLELGALLAGATFTDRKALYDFGVNIGIGFQLKDDLLDAYGDKKKFGKQLGGDIVSNKKTFLLIKAIETAKGKDRAELTRLMSSKKVARTKKVNSVISIYDRLGVQILTEQKISHFFDLSYKSMEKIRSPRKDDLLRFASELADRQW